MFDHQVQFQTPDRFTRVQRRLLLDETKGCFSLSKLTHQLCLKTGDCKLDLNVEPNIATPATLAPLRGAERLSRTAFSEASAWLILWRSVHHSIPQALEP